MSRGPSQEERSEEEAQARDQKTETALTCSFRGGDNKASGGG